MHFVVPYIRIFYLLIKRKGNIQVQKLLYFVILLAYVILAISDGFH